jgi:hypothetical protein
MELLAVAGDEWDGVPLVDEGDDVLDVFLFLAQLPGQDGGDCFHEVSFVPAIPKAKADGTNQKVYSIVDLPALLRNEKEA